MENAGKEMHSDDVEARSEAARLMGSVRSERKAAAAKANLPKLVYTDEFRAKLREAQSARREREKQERIAAGIIEEPKEPKQRGRPRKSEDTVKAPSKGRGRPRKVNEGIETPNSTESLLGANDGNGTVYNEVTE